MSSKSSEGVLSMRRGFLFFAFVCFGVSPLWSQETAALEERARERLEAAQQELNDWRNEQMAQKLRLLAELEEMEEGLLEKRRVVSDLREQVAGLERERRSVEEAGAESARQWEEIRGFIESYQEEQASAFPLAEWAASLTKTDHPEEGIGMARESTGWQELLTRSRERLAQKIAGGRRIDGSAIGEGGERLEGEWKILGPTMIFAGEQGQYGVGFSEVDSLWPQLSEAGEAAMLSDRRQGRSELLPLDPTGGQAERGPAVKTLGTRIQEGGPVMIPILGLGLIALILLLYKAITLRRIKLPEESVVQEIATLWVEEKNTQAKDRATAYGWPMAGLLGAIGEGSQGDRALLEEILYEKILRARPFLERGLPFLALTAATAPLLGLLGTVTGMIQTFDMIALFGTGDPGVLSGGISEALVTTQFGLIVAVPALLAHAFLQRRVKAIQANMEEVSIRLLNDLEEKDYFSRGDKIADK